MPPWEISIPAYGRFLRDFCERLGDRALRAGRQLDGRLHRHRGLDHRARPGRQARCSSPPPASPGPGRGASPRRCSAGSARRPRRSRSSTRCPASAGRACATAPSGASSTTRTRSGRELLWENMVPALPEPRLLRRDDDPVRLRHPPPPRGDRGPDPDRLGPQRPRRPGPGRAHLQEADRRQRRAPHLRPRPATSPRWSGRCASTGCSSGSLALPRRA